MVLAKALKEITLSTEISPRIDDQSKSLLDDRERRSKTAAYYAAFVALGLVAISLGPTLPNLAENTQTVLSEISFLFTARALGYLLGSFLGGRLYDRAPGHPVMAAAVIVMSLTMVLVPMMSLLWLLTGVLLILGMAEGVLDVGGNTLLVWVHREDVGPYMNALHFFFGVGAFLSPVIIAQAVLITGDFTWGYWALALLILPVAVWLLRLASPEAPVESQASRRGVPDGTGTNAVSGETVFLALTVLFFFLYAGAEFGYAGWIFTYAVESGLASETSAAYLTSIFFGALTFGRLLAIPIATRVRPRYVLLGDLVGAIISVGVLLFFPGSISATWLGTIGLGLSLASVFPTTLTLAGRRLTITGRVTGWFFVGTSSGGMIWPFLIGQFFDSIGPQVVMVVILVDLVLAVVVYAAMIRYSERFVVASNA
jgi:fucose permease